MILGPLRLTRYNNDLPRCCPTTTTTTTTTTTKEEEEDDDGSFKLGKHPVTIFQTCIHPQSHVHRLECSRARTPVTFDIMPLKKESERKRKKGNERKQKHQPKQTNKHKQQQYNSPTKVLQQTENNNNKTLAPTTKQQQQQQNNNINRHKIQVSADGERYRRTLQEKKNQTPPPPEKKNKKTKQKTKHHRHQRKRKEMAVQQRTHFVQHWRQLVPPVTFAPVC